MSNGAIVADGPTRDVFAREDLLAQADIIAPQIVRFSNELGTTMLSVDEFLDCVDEGMKPGEGDCPKNYGHEVP